MGSDSTVCGDRMILPKDEELHIYSKGSAPNGHCTMLLHSMEDTTPQCPYKAFCVALTSKMMSSCSAKLFLTGTSFAEAGTNSKVGILKKLSFLLPHNDRGSVTILVCPTDKCGPRTHTL